MFIGSYGVNWHSYGADIGSYGTPFCQLCGLSALVWIEIYGGGLGAMMLISYSCYVVNP
jgi:hypothetical protein